MTGNQNLILEQKGICSWKSLSLEDCCRIPVSLFLHFMNNIAPLCCKRHRSCFQRSLQRREINKKLINIVQNYAQERRSGEALRKGPKLAVENSGTRGERFKRPGLPCSPFVITCSDWAEKINTTSRYKDANGCITSIFYIYWMSNGTRIWWMRTLRYIYKARYFGIGETLISK